MKSFARRCPILSYLALAYLWTWGCALPLLLYRRGYLAAEVSEAWEAVAAFGPLAAAVLVIWLTAGAPGVGDLMRGLTRWRVGTRGLLLGCLSPFLLLALAVLIVGLTSGTWPGVASLAAGRLATATGWMQLMLVAGLVQGLGEEPGWRGFLLPRLRGRLVPLSATLALFPLWLLWHLPAFLGRPEFGLAQFAAFSMGILAAAVWLTFIMQTTGSLLMAVAWHALVNIARGVALALSTPLFLVMSTLVLAGAVLIAGYWLVGARSAYRPVAGSPDSRRD